MTISPRECFNRIDHVAKEQIDSLFASKESSKLTKGREIWWAVTRLFAATIEKYPQGVDISHQPTAIKINKEQVAKIDLSTIDAMLDAEISIWEDAIAPSREQGMEFDGQRAGYYSKISLRTALNISRNNIFNSIGGSTWGPIWGKTKTLESVEKALRA
jgi:hypothetical protein